MAKELDRRFLGKRLVAATRVARWENRLTAAAKKALAVHETRALHVVRTQIARPRSITASIPPDPFGIDTWDTQIVDAIQPAAGGIYAEIRNGTAARFGLNPADLPDVDMTKRFQRLVGKMADLGPRAAARLSDTLSEGVNLGESIPKLADRVEVAFDAFDYDAYRIARTEVIGASNELSLDYATAVDGTPGLSLQKTWLSAGDDRVRGTRDTDEFSHVDADGETVALDEPFEATGEELMYPGDDSGSPGNVINCRCTVIYDEAGTTYDDLRIGPEDA